MICGVWCLVSDVWCLVPGAWCLVPGTPCLIVPIRRHCARARQQDHDKEEQLAGEGPARTKKGPSLSARPLQRCLELLENLDDLAGADEELDRLASQPGLDGGKDVLWLKVDVSDDGDL